MCRWFGFVACCFLVVNSASAIDGQLRGHWTEIPWRRVETLLANSLTLESYVTERWTKNRENVVDFDNVVIAKAYIGPVGKL